MSKFKKINIISKSNQINWNNREKKIFDFIFLKKKFKKLNTKSIEKKFAKTIKIKFIVYSLY